MGVFLVFGIVLLAASFSLIFLIFILKKDSKGNEDTVSSTVLGAFVIISFIAGLSLMNEYCSPSITPIDVYRGKTTLEITYKDSIAIDSTVVWKEEVK